MCNDGMGDVGRVRVMSVGHGPGTQVEVCGKVIDGVLAIKWEVTADSVARLHLTIDGAVIDVDALTVEIETEEMVATRLEAVREGRWISSADLSAS